MEKLDFFKSYVSSSTADQPALLAAAASTPLPAMSQNTSCMGRRAGSYTVKNILYISIKKKKSDSVQKLSNALDCFRKRKKNKLFGKSHNISMYVGKQFVHTHDKKTTSVHFCI